MRLTQICYFGAIKKNEKKQIMIIFIVWYYITILIRGSSDVIHQDFEISDCIFLEQSG